MIFCSHPFCWSSTNTGLAVREPEEDAFGVRAWEVVSRGATWDVAATRITDRMPVPWVGRFAGQRAYAVYFCDGAECLRSHEENPLAQARPRGLGVGRCVSGDEEALAGEAAVCLPLGDGMHSRYVSTLVTGESILAAWEQGQADGSQPLVGRLLPMEHVEQILGEG